MSARRTATAVGIAVAALLPLAAFAQNDLQSTIRAELLKDPRTGVMSRAQIDAMIATLSQNAQQQGLTPQDITWKPTGDQPVTASNFCAPYPRYLCVMSEAFGFIGADYIIPIWLLVLSLLFLLVNALHKHHERVNAFVRATTVPPAPIPPLQSQDLTP
ncbi:MAG TPA: hypothetical protein VHD38_00120 [Candidatus Paceibacterota bacterium]|nr:hypothetical protein [Candidatus Paceibacterota bacterium]